LESRMLLQPTKHSKPDQTVVAVATQALWRLRAKRVIPFQELRRQIHRSNPGTDRLLLPALGLLHILGLLEYLPKRDSFEYTGQ
jgi:ABC-3C biological conflict system middle component